MSLRAEQQTRRVEPLQSARSDARSRSRKSNDTGLARHGLTNQGRHPPLQDRAPKLPRYSLVCPRRGGDARSASNFSARLARVYGFCRKAWRARAPSAP